MKQQANLKGFALIVFVLSFASLLLYWVHRTTRFRPSAQAPVRSLIIRIAPRVNAMLLLWIETPVRSPVGSPTRHRLYRGITGLTTRPFRRAHSRLRAGAEIRAQIPDEADLFLPIANLATGHPNAQVREQGIAYLAQSWDERSVIFLITALMDTELHIRQLSLNALFQRGNRVPVQPLVVFALTTPEMRSQVVSAYSADCRRRLDEVARLEAQLRDYSTNE